MRKIKTLFLFVCVAAILFGCSFNEEPVPTFHETLGNDASISENTSVPDETVEVIPTEASEPEPSTETPTTEPTQAIPSDSTFEIHYIDVGQADSALVLCDGEAMLIDGGNAEDSSLIYAYLKEHGVSHLNYIVCTHAHEDHVGGLSGALNYATVDVAYSPVREYDTKVFKNFVKYLDQQGVSITVPAHGDTFTLGSASCQIIGPINDSDEPNNTSIVLRIQYGETSFLFTGDAESDEEHDILNAGYDVSCTVLKVGHHGSDTSTSYLWLRQAAPQYAVISVGEGNSYGHPTENTLSKLRDADVVVYRTDLQGHIICVSDGQSVSFTVEKNPDADTLAGAGAGGDHGSSGSQETESSDDASSNITTYILNTNTGKFHYPSCSSVDQMADHNKKEVTSTREEMIDQGYSPCGRCKP